MFFDDNRYGNFNNRNGNSDSMASIRKAMQSPITDKLIAEAAANAQAKLAAESAPVYGYTGPIRNQEAPQMDLMSQMRMYQQQKGAENARAQQPQSNNPYQQMQNSRFQQSLSQPAVRQPAASTPAPYYTPGGQASGLGNFGADGVATDLGKIGGGNK